MKILVVDTDVGLDLVIRLAKEGNEIIYFTNWIRSHPELSDLVYGEGILEELGVKRVDNYMQYLEDVDLVLFTDVGWGEDIDFLRERGFIVFGASKDGEELENDRMFAKKICKKYDLDIPETKELNVTEAIDFVKDEGRGFVIKFSKVRSGNFSTYVPINYEDCLFYLGKIAETDRSSTVILEEIIDGIECAITGYFNGESFIKPFFINFEHKKLFDGEIGPNTGEMGTAIIATYEDLPFVDYFKKLEPYLKNINYRGIIDIDCIVNQDGYYVLEFTSRFGYPISMIMPILYEDTFTDIIFGVANGSLKEINAKDDMWAIGVCLNVAGYPYDEIVKKSGFLRIYGIEEALENNCNISFQAVVKRDNNFYTIPGHGRVLVINGLGYDIDQAREKAYSALDYIQWSDMNYRLDIGLKVKRVLPELVKLGCLSKNILKKI